MLFPVLLALLTTVVLAGAAPSGSFPWCSCTTNNYDTPWSLQSYTFEETELTNDYSIIIGQQACTGVSPCCKMDLHKIEFNIGDDCRHSLAGAYMLANTGRILPPLPVKVGYTSYGPGATVVKFTDLGLTTDTAYGSSITFSLKKGSACPTIQDWLAAQSYALFGSNNKCCPLWQFTALQVGGTIWNKPTGAT